MVDARGVPLSLIVTGANQPDVTRAVALLDCARRTPPRRGGVICADKGYDSAALRGALRTRGLTPSIPHRANQRRRGRPPPAYRRHRWVVEATHGWLTRFRKLLVRYEKTLAGYRALLQLACAIIVWRKVGVIYG